MNSTVFAAAFCTVNVTTPCGGENLMALSSRLNRVLYPAGIRRYRRQSWFRIERDIGAAVGLEGYGCTECVSSGALRASLAFQC